MKEIRRCLCELQPTRRRRLAWDSSLFWRFATGDLRGLWDGIERIDYPVATRAVKRLIPRYAENHEYVTGDNRFGIEATGIGFGRCVTDAIAHMHIFFGEGSSVFSSGAVVVLTRVDPAPEFPPLPWRNVCRDNR
jgi:hypothetical protein